MNQRGFTLIEIAIVLIIVTILLGYTMAMVPVQQELKQYRQADAEMSKIIDSLYAFAQVNGYLPCPAWTDDITDSTPAQTSSGLECRDFNGTASDCDGFDPSADTCDIWYGYVPGKTLGIDGKYSDINKLLLDPWGMPYRYQVTNANAGNADPNPDFITPGDIQAEAAAVVAGLGSLDPDLVICNTDPSAVAGNDTACASAAETVFGAAATACTDPDQPCAPIVILSTGKDKALEGDNPQPSWIQRENQDNSTIDRVFIKTSRRDVSGEEFDDLVKWVSPNILYSKMIEAGQLP